MLRSSSHRLQDQDSEKSAWEAEKAGWKTRLCFQRLGFEPQPRECSLHQIDYFEYWLWILSLQFLQKNFFAEPFLCWAKTRREDKVHIAVTVMTNLCVLWFEFRYISVSRRGAWSMFSAWTLVWQSVTCLQETDAVWVLQTWEGTQSFMLDLMRFQFLPVCGELWQCCAETHSHNGPVYSYTITFCLPACWWLPDILRR